MKASSSFLKFMKGFGIGLIAGSILYTIAFAIIDSGSVNIGLNVILITIGMALYLLGGYNEQED